MKKKECKESNNKKVSFIMLMYIMFISIAFAEVSVFDIVDVIRHGNIQYFNFQN